MKHSKRILAALTASAFGLLAGGAQADVFATANITKTKTVNVLLDVDIDKIISLDVDEDIQVDAVAEQSVIKNQRNQFNFVEDENAASTALIDGSAVDASGIVLINQSPGFVNNQGNEVSVTAAKSPVSLDTEVDHGVFAHAEVAVEQVNGVAPDPETGELTPPDTESGFVNEYVNIFESTLSDTIAESFNTGSGVAGVNQAAGSLNNQNNALAVAIGDSAVYALGEADLGQFNTFNLVDVVDQNRTDTIIDSFNGFTGVAMVNQSSGSVNNQANVIDIAVDKDAVLPDLGNIGGTLD